MSINIDIKKITDLLNSSILFPDDLQELLREKYIVLERKSNGTPTVAHIYKTMARFDNKSIYRIAKFLFMNRPDVIKLLFLEDVEPLLPYKSINISINNTEYPQLEGPIGTKSLYWNYLMHLERGYQNPYHIIIYRLEKT